MENIIADMMIGFCTNEMPPGSTWFKFWSRWGLKYCCPTEILLIDNCSVNLLYQVSNAGSCEPLVFIIFYFSTKLMQDLV